MTTQNYKKTGKKNKRTDSRSKGKIRAVLKKSKTAFGANMPATKDHLSEIPESKQSSTSVDESFRRRVSNDKVHIGRPMLSLEFLLTFVSVVAAIASAIFSNISNQKSEEALKLAEDANQIALDSNHLNLQANELWEESIQAGFPDVQVRYKGIFRWVDIQLPCTESSGRISWNKEVLTIFEVVNLGGRASAVIELPKSTLVDTGIQGVQAEVNFSPFVSKDQFSEWWRENVPSSAGANSYDSLFAIYESWAPLITPVTLQPGEARLIILLQHIEVEISSELTSIDVSEAVDDYIWQAYPSFVFADGKEIESRMWVLAPYLDTPYPFYDADAPSFGVCE